jgi:phenylalanyl-tRNA synthetase beta chain
VDIPLPIEELAERMTLAGLEVGAIEYVGLPGAELEWDRDKVVVGKIVEIKPHPNADRLVLAVVDYGGDELETCVTGAPNLYPYKGQSDLSLKAPFAMEGARLWDAYSDTPKIRKLKKTKIRGISSRAMVCSERELGLGEDHTGIMLLPDDAPPPGTPLSDYLGDVVLDLDLTPNLARCFSVIGVAREVAALTGGQVRYPSYDVVMEGPPIEGQVEVVIEDAALAPRFTAHLIRDVETRPSPLWMQRRLILAGQRPISNVVDITNYVMLEVGQPLHAFDYDGLLERARRVGGEDAVPRIIVRAARPGEGMESIDHVYREFQPYDILITDTAGPVGIGGVMGGVETEISETTTNILLEAANFNFYHIRRTAQYHKLPSEASARFGRGIHPAQAILGGRRSTEMMRQLGGGVVAQGVIDVYPGQLEPVTVELTLDEVERILGLSLSLEEVRGILESLEFQVETLDHLLRVTVPDHRTEVTLPADLIEEVARIYGYDRIPTTTLSDALPPQRTNLELVIEERMRDLLVRAGLQEIITYRLTTPEREARLLPPDTPPDERPYIALTNPISAERAFMRHSLLNSVLEIAADNARFHERIALYEISKVFIPRMEDEGRGAALRDETGLPDEPRRLVVVLAGPREMSSWQDEGNGEDMDFYDLKGVVESLLQGLCVETVAFRPVEHPSYHPGRTAELVLNDQPAGVLGQLHPLVCEAYGLTDYPLLAADLDVEVLRAATRLQHAVRSVSRYPAALQDIAVVVDEDVPAAEVQAVIEQAGGWLLRGVRLFDQYRGAQVGAGKKSLAYSLTFQADDRTLTDRDANKLRGKIVRQLKKKLGATLRA